jgi:aspartate aminotransferase-like enzyme
VVVYETIHEHLLLSGSMKRKVLLNPGPVTTKRSIKKALLVPDICHRAKEFYLVVDEVRDLLLQIVRGYPDYSAVLFSSSGTGAVEACISSAVPKNKKIALVINGTFGARMVEIAEAHNIEVVKVTSSDTLPFSVQNIDEILAKDPDIACVAAVYHETSSGILNPIEALAEIVKKRGRMLIVDAIFLFWRHSNRLNTMPDRLPDWHP